jgi:hypothetical protein
MNPKFKQWLEQQTYTYYKWHTVNNDTDWDWCIKVEGMDFSNYVVPHDYSWSNILTNSK